MKRVYCVHRLNINGYETVQNTNHYINEEGKNLDQNQFSLYQKYSASEDTYIKLQYESSCDDLLSHFD